MNLYRTYAETACGYVLASPTGEVNLGFLGHEITFASTEDFIDFADAIACQTGMESVPVIRLVVYDLDITVSGIDFIALQKMIATASSEARWWAGYQNINVAEMGFRQIKAR